MTTLIAFVFALASGGPSPDEVGVADEARVLDAELAKGLVVVQLSEGPREGSVDQGIEAYERCKNELTGGKSIELVVVDLRARKVIERHELAGWPEEGPCPTSASYDKVHAKVKARLAPRGLDIARPSGPKKSYVGDGEGAKSVIVERRSDDGEMSASEKRAVEVGAARLLETEHEWGTIMAGRCTMHEWLLEDDGLALVLQAAECSSMRGGGKTWAVYGPVKLPSNGVDVAALTRAVGDGKCALSIATNASLEKTVAVTVRHALDGGGKRAVPLSIAQKERESSVVYAKEPCGDVAKAVAAVIPGGAKVEPLTWDAKAQIVVALGKSAVAK